ncbi:MAG: hypothetical protein HY681_06755 [Chloroflexi bacterium]|nr:hypothetical protein [Chloroflexota bacterium]
MPSVRGKIAFWFIDRFVPAVFPRINPAARWLLKSRLHCFMSWYVVLLCFSGRRSGRR